MQHIFFCDLPLNYKETIEKIKSKLLKRIYLQFHFYYFKYETTQDKEQFKALIISFLDEFKFITYGVFTNDNSKNEKLVAICTEEKIIIIELEDLNYLKQLFTESRSIIINASKNELFLSEDTEITDFCKLNDFTLDIKRSSFIGYTIYPISYYIIKRYSYPTHYFKNPSFFKFDKHDNFYEEQEKMKIKLNEILQSNLKEEIQLKLTEVMKSNLNTVNVRQRKIYEFLKDDFVEIKVLFTNEEKRYSLVLHKESLFLFAMKIVNHENTINEEKFCRNCSSEYFTRFYGFIKQENQVTAFIYEYMCNGSYDKFIEKNHEKFDEFYSLLTVFRLFNGLKFLQTNSLIHRDLKQSNILVDHDYIPYISDFEFIKSLNDCENDLALCSVDFSDRPMNQPPEFFLNETHSYLSDIYSFGLIVYYIFENKQLSKENIDFLPEMKNGSERLKSLFYLTVKFNPNERIDINEIQYILYNEIKSSFYLNKYFLKENNKQISITNQYIIEHIKILNYSELQIFINHIYILLSLNLNSKENKLDNSKPELLLYCMNFNINFNITTEYFNQLAEFCNSYSINEFKNFQKNLKQNHIQINPKKICDKISSYSFTYIDKTADFNILTYQNLILSKVIVINEYKNEGFQNIFFIACFQNTVIMINQALISILQSLFTPNLKICFLSNTRNIFKQNNITIQNEECDNQYISNEILNFQKIFSITNKKGTSSTLINIIRESISAYLIQQGYEKANKMQSLPLSTLQDNTFNLEETEETNFIKIRDLGIGSSFYVGLFFHIKKEELFVIKNPIKKLNYERLINRYIDNYKIFNHPLLPKLYGKIKDKQDLIVQFINGQTLESFITKNKNQLNDEEKYKIISQIIIIIEYLHDNEFVFRDLKPDNIIVDKNKTIFIIDFDRNVKVNDVINDENRTQYFSSVYHAPEIITNEISYKSDIYSIGQIIYYIMNEQNPDPGLINYNNNDNLFKNNLIQTIYINCINNDIQCRPCISKLKEEFIKIYPNFIKFIGYIRQNPFESNQNYTNKQNINNTIMLLTLLSNQNNPKAQYLLGHIYYDDEYVERDINKSIHYFTLASNQNYLNAQYFLGYIYFEGKYISRDINKSIHFLNLASNQNDPYAQYDLGCIYFEGKYVERDINKSVYYFTLASNQNHPDAQYNLGCIYLEGKYITRDINKSIHYFTLASNQNHPDAQYNLGCIYFEGKCITRDINKSIHYLTLASNQNYSKEQYELGRIYFEGKYITRDINKSIHYLTLASNQNYSQAQYFLGCIYIEGKYITRDINKSIQYLTLASNQNYSQAQYELGCIYHEGEYVTRDINKSIYYLTLASNQNHIMAQYELGCIYYEGKYIARNINKSIHYLKLGLNQNDPYAQCLLGLIYLTGEYIKQDVHKAIHYLTLSSIQKCPDAQYYLGYIYYFGYYVKQDIKKSIHYLTLSSNNNYSTAQFLLGIYYLHHKRETNIKDAVDLIYRSSLNKYKKSYFYMGYFYHKGIHVQRNIKESIKYYKQGSTFNCQYSKNNLGIIYKHGFDLEIEQNIGNSLEYFSELVSKFNNNIVAMYNLSHIYIFEVKSKEKIDESIDLLIKSSSQKFKASYFLLCIALIEKHGNDAEKIKQDLIKKTGQSDGMTIIILDLIGEFFYESSFQKNYDIVKNTDFLYDDNLLAISSQEFFKEKIIEPKYKFAKNITSQFYDGLI